MKSGKSWQHIAPDASVAWSDMCNKNVYKKIAAYLWSGVFLMGCTVGIAQAVQVEGIGFLMSRVVMMAEKRGGATITLNNNTDNVYLMQNRVQQADVKLGAPVSNADAEKVEKMPFMVLPPLSRVEERGTLPLHIILGADNTLPEDRESLFFLTAKAIPAVPSKPDNGKPASNGSESSQRIILALENSIKLFYRPKGLKDDAIASVAGLLTVSRHDNQLRLTNPTPYYATLSSLKVNGKPVAEEALNAMIPPKGWQDYPLPPGVTRGDVSWQLIDEYGLTTDAQSKPLHD
ncbi:MAG: molecular chaperone [Enterobacteriaceae bacterium]|jgi:fimbrial chaperone protein|nr:molecular chaperone [Enterobacteriaceae bacterium]